jgi:hypothetical protein
MGKSIRDTTKQETRGRKKTTGPGEPIMLRLHAPLLTHLDRWIEEQDGQPSRPEAIRRILESVLAQLPSNPARSPDATCRASELAPSAIDSLTDKKQPIEEQQRRKRQLVRGPKESGNS